jgi:hypothetical protein
MTPEQIKTVLDNHSLWLEGEGGERANLEGANLKKANLEWANLRWASLRGGDLEGANLEGANLKKANLEGANLRWTDLKWASLIEADLEGANLYMASLIEADLRWTDLKWANLEGANLYGANLEGANLSRASLIEADLEGANLRWAKLPAFQITPQGLPMHGFKKLADGTICTLLIPAEAKRTASLVSRKCRAEYVVVVGGEGVSRHDKSIVYKVGETVRPDYYNDDIRIDCTSGIHFFQTREEAEAY